MKRTATPQMLCNWLKKIEPSQGADESKWSTSIKRDMLCKRSATDCSLSSGSVQNHRLKHQGVETARFHCIRRISNNNKSNTIACRRMSYLDTQPGQLFRYIRSLLANTVGAHVRKNSHWYCLIHIQHSWVLLRVLGIDMANQHAEVRQTNGGY